LKGFENLLRVELKNGEKRRKIKLKLSNFKNLKKIFKNLK
jgi:hypothetical protein